MAIEHPAQPKPGTTATQRKAEFDNPEIVKRSTIRHLAYQFYKQPDGSPVATYAQTIDNFEDVKWAVIRHEVATGQVIDEVDDGKDAGAAAMGRKGAAARARTMTPATAKRRSRNGSTRTWPRRTQARSRSTA